MNAFSERSIANVLRHPASRQFKRDDLLDALAALWSAERIARSESESLPHPPERDSEGLTRAIHF